MSEAATVPKRIAIVGTALTTLRLAPYDDPSWEIWGLNALHTFGVRWDRWFELHSRDGLQKWLDGKHWQWLTEQQPGKPIYMQKKFDEVPASVLFPSAHILEKFPPYFTNSVSWMTAMAICEGATEIGIWGCDMANDTEYAHQRQNCEWMLGIAFGMGIKITMPPACDLLKADHLYAIEKPTPMMAKLLALKDAHATKVSEMERKLAHIREAEREAQDELNQFMGALQATTLITNRR